MATKGALQRCLRCEALRWGQTRTHLTHTHTHHPRRTPRAAGGRGGVPDGRQGVEKMWMGGWMDGRKKNTNLPAGLKKGAAKDAQNTELPRRHPMGRRLCIVFVWSYGVRTSLIRRRRAL